MVAGKDLRVPDPCRSHHTTALALEKRLLALEQETLQNNMLFEKFIRRLDDHYEITKGAQITEMKNEVRRVRL